MSPDELAQTIDASTLDPVIRAALQEWPGAEELETEIEETVAWVNDIIRGMQGVFRQLQDEDVEELQTQTAIAYIELKSRWIALNTKINYETFREGSCRPVDAFRASAVSIVLAELESRLTQRDIDAITDFLAEPVRRAA
jgi:hypothetical protein